MDKLCFSPLSVSPKKMWTVLGALFLLSFLGGVFDVFSILAGHTKDIYGYEVNVFKGESEDFAFIYALLSVLALIPMYFALQWVNQSILNEKFQNQIRYFFYFFIAATIIGALSTFSSIPEETESYYGSDSVDLLSAAVYEIISGVIGAVSLVILIAATVFCVKKGDKDVKTFMLIWLIVGFLCPALFYGIILELGKGFHQLILFLISAACGVYPFYYLLNNTNNQNEATVDFTECRQNPDQTNSNAIDTNPEPTDDSIPTRMLRWTDYSVYIALIAFAIGMCSLSFSNGLDLVLKLIGLILSNGAIVALIYRFLTGFYEKYSSDTSLFNNSLHVASNIFFLAIPIASMLASCAFDFLTYDHYSIFSNYDAIIIIYKLNSVLAVATCGFAAYYGYYLRSRFEGKLKKLGLSLMIFGALTAISGIYGLSTTFNPYESQEVARELMSNEALSLAMIALYTFGLWVCMWPFRIMTKLLVNGENNPDSSSARNI